MRTQSSWSPMEKWISVKDKLPDNDEKIVAYHSCNDIYLSGPRITRYKYGSWDGVWAGIITHWLPIPADPEIDK